MVSQVWTHHFRWGGKLEQSSSHRGSKNQRKRMFLCHPLEMMNRKFLGDLSSFPLILSKIKPMHIVYLFPRFSKTREVGNQNEPWNLSTEKVTFAHCKARTAVGMRHWGGGGCLQCFLFHCIRHRQAGNSKVLVFRTGNGFVHFPQRFVAGTQWDSVSVIVVYALESAAIWDILVQSMRPSSSRNCSKERGGCEFSRRP